MEGPLVLNIKYQALQRNGDGQSAAAAESRAGKSDPGRYEGSGIPWAISQLRTKVEQPITTLSKKKRLSSFCIAASWPRLMNRHVAMIANIT